MPQQIIQDNVSVFRILNLILPTKSLPPYKAIATGSRGYVLASNARHLTGFPEREANIRKEKRMRENYTLGFGSGVGSTGE